MLQNVPHQIVPSPARLGLPNPNSPALQTPPKFSPQSAQFHQQPNIATGSTTTSSTLLPLLPPLSRAQSLLVQMASREIRSKDSAILVFANKLREAEHVLDVLVDDYSDYRRPKHSKLEDDESSTTTVATQIKLTDIISYAHKRSYTTFAPTEFGAGQAPLCGALPPAPQEEQLRASQLYSCGDLDVGIPKTEEDKEAALEPFIDVPAQPMESNSHLAVFQG